MREMRTEERHRGGEEQRARLNPADPFMVRGEGARRIDVTPEQRRALQRLRDAVGRRVPRHDMPSGMLASLLRRRMITLYGDRVELTVLGALALATPLPDPRD
jgi:hypothetical protein